MNFGIGGNLSGGKGILSMILIDELLSYDKTQRLISVVPLSKIAYPSYEFFHVKDLANYILQNLDNYENLKKTFSNSVLFLDEIRNLISARKSTTNLNEALTTFLMTAGKIDCQIVFTYQLFTSQVDIQLREITDYNFECTRVLSDGSSMPLKYAMKRIPKNDKGELVEVCIQVEVMSFQNDKLFHTGIMQTIPFEVINETGKKYKTRYLSILDRSQFLTRNRR